MKKINIEIKWALVFVATTLIWIFLERMAGLHGTHIDKHPYLTNLFAIPAIIIYVLALRDKKKNFYMGQISYKQAFFSGLMITLIVVLFSPLTQWLVSNVVSPDYFPNVIAYSVEKGYYETKEEAEAYFNVKNYIIQGALGALGMGIITSAIVAFFVRTKTR